MWSAVETAFKISISNSSSTILRLRSATVSEWHLLLSPCLRFDCAQRPPAGRSEIEARAIQSLLDSISMSCRAQSRQIWTSRFPTRLRQYFDCAQQPSQTDITTVTLKLKLGGIQSLRTLVSILENSTSPSMRCWICAALVQHDRKIGHVTLSLSKCFLDKRNVFGNTSNALSDQFRLTFYLIIIIPCSSQKHTRTHPYET